MILLSEMYYYQHRFIFNTIICKESKEVIIFACVLHTRLGLSSVIGGINLRSNKYIGQQIRVLVWQPPFEIEQILIFHLQGGEKININSMYLIPYQGNSSITSLHLSHSSSFLLQSISFCSFLLFVLMPILHAFSKFMGII